MFMLHINVYDMAKMVDDERTNDTSVGRNGILLLLLRVVRIVFPSHVFVFDELLIFGRRKWVFFVL